MLGRDGFVMVAAIELEGDPDVPTLGDWGGVPLPIWSNRYQ